MWIWDGTDREEGDGQAAFADLVRRALISSDPELTAHMRTYVAAFSLGLTNRKGSALATPEPLIQGGFTPSDDERSQMCEMARRDGRDLVHICFRTVEPFTPTGLIVIVYLDGDTVRLHSRTSLIWVATEECIRLYGVEDEPDLNCHFVFRAGEKISRRDGFPSPAGSPELKQAAARIEALIARGAIGDVGDERLAFYHELACFDDGLPLLSAGLRSIN
ncbi:hypothetical protein BH10PSE14_BH10PSE14_35310 [soil metagenome]